MSMKSFDCKTDLGQYLVSTVIVEAFGQIGKPDYYETIVCARCACDAWDWAGVYFERYETALEAARGHARIVEQYWGDKQ